MLVEEAKLYISWVEVNEYSSVQTLNRICTYDDSSPYRRT